MSRGRTMLLAPLTVLIVIGSLSSGCQSGESKAPPHADGGAVAQGLKQGVTPAASGKQVDHEQQQFLNREAESAGK